jgi:hypothetical protein
MHRTDELSIVKIIVCITTLRKKYRYTTTGFRGAIFSLYAMLPCMVFLLRRKKQMHHTNY